MNRANRREANLSDAIRWLQVSYSSAFNWAHQVRGHLFQGRFRSLLIEDGKGMVEVARYLHLNPVRDQGLGLGKAEQRRARMKYPAAAAAGRRFGRVQARMTRRGDSSSSAFGVRWSGDPRLSNVVACPIERPY